MKANPGPGPAPAAGECDLASRWVGGTVVAASDESFGEKEHLLDPAPCNWQPGRYGPRGEIVDGWETRRRRGGPGEDWAIIRLGLQGIVTAVDVDTTSFTGNHPVTCRIEATGCEGYPGPGALLSRTARWETLVPDQELGGNAHHLLPVVDERCWTHLRLVIAPDGGVARLRAYGLALPDPRRFDGLSVDLASWSTGGLVVASSDDFYGAAQVLNRPDQARNMGEGWETRRRRDDGHDWVLIRLGYAGPVSRLVFDTSFYRYNASEAVSVTGSSTHDDAGDWAMLLARTELQPDTVHDLAAEPTPAVRFIRVAAYPDGGISRIRVLGHIDPAHRAFTGRRWWNALPEPQAQEVLAGAGVPPEAAAALVGDRPLALDAPAPEPLRVLLDGRDHRV
ncbi:MAG: allantoicase [Acidimicrobiales bacterium]